MNRENRYIDHLISKMSLDQKVGALLTLGFAGTLVRQHIIDFITKYQCGGLRLTPHARTFGSYIDPKSGKSVIDVMDFKGYKKGLEPPHVTASEYQAVLGELQALAMGRPLGIPLHFSFDQEGGTSADFDFGGVNIFPKPMGIRSTGDSRLAYEVGLAVARQSRAVGFNWIHSPVLDINVNPENPEVYTRAYSDRIEEIAEYAIETCKGLKAGGLIGTAKHFPGRGDSAVDAHFEMPIIDADRQTMLRRELLPYRALIERKLIPSIMIAHSIFPAFDPVDVATVSRPILTGLLREEMGFEGVITTDSMTMGGIAVRYGVANACALALAAGADLVLMKSEGKLVEETIAAIKAFVADGRIPERDLDDKVYRVLSLKYEYGLFNQGSNWPEQPEAVLRDPSIVDLSRLVARRSVLVARDEPQRLPLPKDEPVLVIEQINKCPNDLHWHPGILMKQCLKYNPKVEYLETAYTWDDDDKANIRAAFERFETIVITNFYIRAKLSNNQAITDLLRANPGKRVIVVTNTPYPLSVPEAAGSLVITFATSPANIEVVAGVLFGAVTAEGEWPVEYRLK